MAERATPPTVRPAHASSAEVFGPKAFSGPSTYPPGFADSVVFSGLTNPTVVQFAPDGRVYVGEKGGQVVEFDSLTDTTPLLVKDLSRNVYDFWDRGLLGMALDPNFPTNPYVYVLYTMDGPIGSTPPVYHDSCADPEGAGCAAGARLSRVRVRADGTGGREQVLIEGWCQQFPSHSIGTLAFGPDGALYVGGGDGASFDYADYGQAGNPCADPVDEGGALRSQDLLTTADPTGLNGAILRVDPATGNALPDNPLYGGDPTDDRLIAEGLRNPFRFTVEPGTDRVFIGDVGWYTWEEVDRLRSAGDGVVENFGWPCFEGKGHEPDYDALNLPICEDLYGQAGAVTKPLKALNHGPGGCRGSNVFSGMALYPGGTYPPQYVGALFFADVVRGCMWSMLPKPNGDPDPSTLSTFATGVGVVDIKAGPGGDLFYVDIYGGSVHRITYG